MRDLKFTPRGRRDISSLPKNIQRRILTKLRENANLENPLVRAKHLTDLPPATHRYRIGKYRISFYVEHDTLFVERVEIRDQAYRRN